jgi:hypothetical protein
VWDVTVYDAGETVDLIEPWIYASLLADSDLMDLVGVGSISGTLSVGDLEPPYVTFLNQDSRDIVGNAGLIISTSNLYAIKAVARTGSWDDVRPIAARIKALFHLPGREVMVPGGSLTSNREILINYAEITEGVQYRHLGAVFRIRASRDE